MTTYTVYVFPEALREVKNLPGHIRQRVKRTIDDLADTPRPSGSIELSDVSPPTPTTTLCRLKIDKWRIIYAISESDQAIDVLAVRQRPPYDYGDLYELIQQLR